MKIRANGADTKSTFIGVDVWQGYYVLPTVFSVYGEWLINEEDLKALEDFKVGESIIKATRNVGDVVLIARTEEKLQRTLDRPVVTGRGYRIKINAEKSKVMKILKDEEQLKILIENRQLDNVS